MRLKEQYFTQRGSLVERNKTEFENFENNYSVTLDQLADKIYSDLDCILPDEFVNYISVMSANYGNFIFKVNGTSEIQDEVLNMTFVDYPVDYFVQSKIVASIIKEKCAKLLVEGAIRLPIMMSIVDAPVWTIVNDRSNASVVQDFTHSIIFGMLSSTPVAQLSYSIVDPENRGNSITPFFDAKKRLPELFGEKIIINKEDIALKISKMNEYIETILQDRLGNQYETVFDYANEHSDIDVNIEMLVLYDFPKGFDERTLSELRNILRNGRRCGIYILMIRNHIFIQMKMAEVLILCMLIHCMICFLNAMRMLSFKNTD